MKINDVVNMLSKKFSAKDRPFPTDDILKLAQEKLDVAEFFSSKWLSLDEFDFDEVTDDIVNTLINNHFTREDAIDAVFFVVSIQREMCS
jgi:hypothetical protein